MLDLKEVPKITQSNLQPRDDKLGLPMNWPFGTCVYYGNEWPTYIKEVVNVPDVAKWRKPLMMN
jgi:hypothetical protein